MVYSPRKDKKQDHNKTSRRGHGMNKNGDIKRGVKMDDIVEKTDFSADGLWQRSKTIYISSLSSDLEKNQAENYFSMVSRVFIENNIL